MQKFEVMPHDPYNAISEDVKGSKGLKAHGRPVTFNYGCFPQTYRDPHDVDPISGVGGDDDPLDAVCLIDEGQADWKILAVNVDEKGPLSRARTIEEVEQIMPGRVNEVLGWIDGLKKEGEEAALNWHVHGIDQAIDLLERDHASWRRLVDEAGPDGMARGHWIRQRD